MNLRQQPSNFTQQILWLVFKKTHTTGCNNVKAHYIKSQLTPDRCDSCWTDWASLTAIFTLVNEAGAAHTHFADIHEIFSPFQWFFFYNHLKSGRSSGFLSKNSSFRFFHSFSKRYQTEMYVSLLTSYSSLPTNMAAARFLIMIIVRLRHVHTTY